MSLTDPQKYVIYFKCTVSEILVCDPFLVDTEVIMILVLISH